MAEQSAQDVVIETQSVGHNLPVDNSGTTYEPNSTGAGEGRMLEQSEQEHAANEARQSKSSEHDGTPNTSSNTLAYETNAGLSANFKDDHLHSTQASEDSQPQAQGSSILGGGLVNGETGSNVGSDDAGYQNSTEIDTNPGSDTEATKGDNAGQGSNEVVRRERSDSVKKVPAFKAVSVTKNFLAKSGAGQSATDKVTPASQPTLPVQQPNRPRLVAKLGRDARSSNAASGLSTGPDANRVWNRNQPVPAPVPKQFTDEELKQQYGIHLATRLQADEGGKDAKWADIDDDEDDWAPETVQWMDGTKSTITPTENALLLVADSRGVVSAQLDSSSQAGSSSAPVAIASLPTPPSPATPTSVAPGKTILRPGVRIQTNQTKPGLVLKGVPEKPVLLAKPSSTSAVKSPWAPLPPVDKASPITFVPPPSAPAQQPERVFDGRDSQRPETNLSSMPTREIAADDFNRTWQSEHGNRELFNSQSGRYETVRPPRRPSRQESSFRPPSAVLQRPSYSGTNPYPEPSTSFQFSRESTGEDRSSWARRRGSAAQDDRHSALDRRTPAEQPTGHLGPVVVQEDSAIAAQQSQPMDASLPVSALQNGSLIEAQASDGPTSHHIVQDSQGQAAGDKTGNFNNASQPADVRAAQQQLMKERIELNRKRKQEEEAKEEAAKQERIKSRLAALAAAQPTDTKPELSEEKAIETATEVSQPQVAVDSRAVSNKPTTTPTVTPQAIPSESPDKSTKQSIAKTAAAVTPIPSPPSVSEMPAVNDNVSRSHANESLNADNNSTLSREAPNRVEPLNSHLGGANRHQAWKPVPIQEPTGWAPGKRITAHPTSGVANVWGPPTSDRMLGNGAFVSEFQRMGPPPGPIAPPSQVQSPVVNSELFNGVAIAPSSLFGTVASVDNSLPPTGAYSQRPRSPPLDRFQRRSRAEVRPTKAGSAWSTFANQLPQLEAEASKRAAQEQEARLVNESTPDFQPVYKETFRQTVMGNVLGQRQVVAVSKVIHEGSNTIPESRVSMPIPGPSYNEPIGHASPPQLTTNGRASRFFGPRIERPLASAVRSPLEPSIAVDTSSSPPPDGVGHPAFEGIAAGPRVNLPPPAPKVRLPPATGASAATNPDSVAMQLRNQNIRSGAQPLVTQLAWQYRFNGLFGRAQSSPSSATAALPVEMSGPSSSVKQKTLAIDSSSKAPLDDSSARDITTVSLPSQTLPANSATADPSLIEFVAESKPAVDELMDDRQLWSLPTVNFPKSPYANAFELLSTLLVRYTPSKFVNLEKNYEFSATSFPIPFQFLEAERFTEAGYTIFISLCGYIAQKFVPRKSVGPGSAPHHNKNSRNNKKRHTPSGGISSGSQSPRPFTDSITTENDPRTGLESDHRISSWNKAARGGRYRQDKHIDAASKMNPMSGSAEVSNTHASKSVWAKPAKGGRGGFGPRY